MPIPPELGAADERMTKAKDAMNQYIDEGGTDAAIRYALLIELTESIANFEEILKRAMEEWSGGK